MAARPPSPRSEPWVTERLMQVRGLPEFREFSDSDLTAAILSCGRVACEDAALMRHLQSRCRNCCSAFPRHRLVSMATCECELCPGCFCSFLQRLPAHSGCPACGTNFDADPQRIEVMRIRVYELGAAIGGCVTCKMLRMLDDWGKRERQIGSWKCGGCSFVNRLPSACGACGIQRERLGSLSSPNKPASSPTRAVSTQTDKIPLGPDAQYSIAASIGPHRTQSDVVVKQNHVDSSASIPSSAGDGRTKASAECAPRVAQPSQQQLLQLKHPPLPVRPTTGIPPSSASIDANSWQCGHCTFINQKRVPVAPDNNSGVSSCWPREICSMCNRTLEINRSEILQRLLKIPELQTHDFADLAAAAKVSEDRLDYVDFSLKFLNCKCSSCFENRPKNKLILMPSCQCEICFECFYNFVTTTLRSGEHVTGLHCKMCETPNANDVGKFESHFAMLLQQVQNFQHPTLRFEPNDITLLEKKILEWNLMRDPNFRWCSCCDIGVIVDQEMLKAKFQCPNCKSYTCKDCGRAWTDQHEELTCEQYNQWLQDNDPELQQKGGVGYFLETNGIECPNCKFRYELAKGGCMHFICRQCKFEFCTGCRGKFEKVGSHGLKCQHPRDCLFYLRDFGVERLQQLLTKHNVEFQAVVDPAVDNCQVMEQKETEGRGMTDEACGVAVLPGHANLCEKHYIEYLASLVNKSRLDPVEVMEEGELKGVCLRHHIDCSQVGDNPDNMRALIMQQVPLVQ